MLQQTLREEYLDSTLYDAGCLREVVQGMIFSNGVLRRITGIIIHSKYFPISDWLKPHALFTITSCCWPNLEKILSYWTDDFKMMSKVQPCCRLLSTWGRGWVVLVVRTKWRNCRGIFCSFHGEILSKNIGRTARRQLAGQHLLFGVYLQTWADLNLLNFPIKMHYRYELTSTEVSRF